MNKNKIVLALAMLLFFTFSCKDEDLAPIVTFDSAGKGAYPRLVSDSGDQFVNLFDIAGSRYNYTAELIDNEGGSLVAEYIIDVTFVDNDPSNGDKGTTAEYLKYSSSDFSMNSNGYQEAPEISLNGPDILARTGLAEDDISAGDQFRFISRLILTDGSIFTQANSSATIVGSAFRGIFNITMNASCPSDLTGTYDYTTTDVWCNGSSISGTVDIIAAGGGTYYWSDPSFGAYVNCYGGPASDPGLTFSDVCLEVGFVGVIDQYGDTWTYDSSVDGDSWVINWVNTYGEAANSTITFPGGVPFTLK